MTRMLVLEVPYYLDHEGKIKLCVTDSFLVDFLCLFG